jgi:hypothetical protein
MFYFDIMDFRLADDPNMLNIQAISMRDKDTFVGIYYRVADGLTFAVTAQFSTLNVSSMTILPQMLGTSTLGVFDANGNYYMASISKMFFNNNDESASNFKNVKFN